MEPSLHSGHIIPFLQFFFIVKRFFSHTMHSEDCFVSLHTFQLTPISPLPQICPTFCCLSERAGLRETTNKHDKQDKIKGQKPPYQDWTRQLLIRVPRTGKEWETHSPPLLGVLHNSKPTAMTCMQRTWCWLLRSLCLLPLSSWVHKISA